jgi:hypothetical protein
MTFSHWVLFKTNTNMVATNCPSPLDHLALPANKGMRIELFMKRGVVISTRGAATFSYPQRLCRFLSPFRQLHLINHHIK